MRQHASTVDIEVAEQALRTHGYLILEGLLWPDEVQAVKSALSPWLQGERYRDKMRHDEQRLLEHAIDQSTRNRPESARSRRQGAETARPRSAEPFAPPGRPVVLSPRLANELDASFVLRTAPVPRATPAPPSLQRPSSSQRPSTSARSTRAAAHPQAGRPMSAIPALLAQSQTSRPPTAPLPREGPPMTLAYERGGMISTHRFESGRR